MAEQEKDVRAMIEILRYLTDRRDGKPYIAENPVVSHKADALQQDTRLQAAIQELVLSPAPSMAADEKDRVI
jgi:hypothetical protein